MALQLLFSPFAVCPPRLSSLHSTKNPSTTKIFKISIRCAASTVTVDDPPVIRRSAEYMPSVWDYDFVQTLTSDYNVDEYMKQAQRLKEAVKHLINGAMDPLVKLELIDAVQRLGLKYQFETEIKEAIDIVYKSTKDAWQYDDDLYATALRFRLFRQLGHNVPQDEFQRFKDKTTGKFKTVVSEDVKGLLSLYEASFFGLEGETTMDEAKAFSTSHLKDVKGNISPSLARKVVHALDMPVHWRLNRLEARWCIDTYEQERDMNHTLLQLAKLDYNIVQSVHRTEVGKLARWWVDLGLGKMGFARDRLLEHHLWISGMVFEPQFGEYREMATKIISLITVIDDIYDVYGTLEEVELITDFVNRWDINGIDKLPHSIKTCLLAMYNTSNEIGYWTMKEKGFNIIPYLSKQWAKLCKAYLKEARWYHGGYKPTLDEYLDNAVVSVAAPLMLFSSYFLTTEKITEEALDYIDKLPSIMRGSSMLLRLTNDLETSSYELARGDTLKAVECYMNEKGVTEEVAKEHINYLVHETWKRMNKDVYGNYPFSEPFLSANPNLGRTSQCFYQYGDGHGIPDRDTKHNLMSLLVEPVSLN